MLFIGNKKVVTMLSSSLAKGKLNHAYIFSGPEAVGKFTLAKMFALSAIGRNSLIFDTDLVDKDAILDLIVVEPAIVEKNKVSKQRDISIEAVREAKLSLSLFPYHGKYKVLIVRDAHRMNLAAQNGLLKVLEEPNQTTLIILVTNEIDRMLPTIISRCQMVNFGLVSETDMTDALLLNDVVKLSNGRPGQAIVMANDNEEFNFKAEAQNQFRKISSGSINERFALAETFSKDIVKTLEKLNVWIWEMRKDALNAGGKECENIYEKIEKIQKSMQILKRTNANGRLILETLFMDL